MSTPIGSGYTAPVWNFSNILDEFRNICGIPDASMYSDTQCANLINYYYQYVLLKELKISWGYSFYQFYAQANIDQYLAPLGWQTVNPSVYADGFPVEWYLDPDTFYQDYPQQENKQTLTTYTGGPQNFGGNISAYPVLPRSCYITDGYQVAQDVPNSPPNGSGTFFQVAPSGTTGALGGSSINYQTGVIVGVNFLSTPSVNSTITVASQTYLPNRPQGILFFPQQPLINAEQATLDAVNMFVLRPVPDQTYLIKMQGIKTPQPFLNFEDVPFRPDLGPLIALGAALHRFKLFNQMDQYNENLPEYMRFKDICMQDTYEELIYERSIPRF